MAFLRGLAFVVLAMASQSAFAQYGNNGNHNEAARVCEGAQFSSDRENCLREVRTARSFDRRALEVCSRISFSSNRAECIRTIKDKRYDERELRQCMNEAFDDGKLKCLRRAGNGNGGHPGNGGGYGGGGYGHGHGHGNNITGPGVTRRWMSAGEQKLMKISTVRTIDLRGEFVNEIQLSAIKESIIVEDVLVYLVDGSVISVRELSGSIRDNRSRVARLDRRNSLRVDRIEIRALAGLIGSRGSLRVDIGLAR